MQTTHYKNVKEHINDALLCIVSKKRSLHEIQEFYDCGERIFCENRANELVEKAKHLPSDIAWHYIGYLQSNKVRMLLPYTSLIQSVDRLSIAETIHHEAERIHKVQDILIEVHLAQEDTNKAGLKKEELFPLINHLATFHHIRIQGLMVMGPHTNDKDRICEVFQEAHALFETCRKQYGEDKMKFLSMGMSQDYQIALDCGSNMVRIGTYLFEDKGD